MLIVKQDFVEMLERGDSLEKIAAYYGILPRSAYRRFFRLSKAERDEITRKRGSLVSDPKYYLKENK